MIRKAAKISEEGRNEIEEEDGEDESGAADSSDEEEPHENDDLQGASDGEASYEYETVV
jgi:hypothetical protein